MRIGAFKWESRHRIVMSSTFQHWSPKHGGTIVQAHHFCFPNYNWIAWLFQLVHVSVYYFFKKKTKSMNGLLSFNLLQGWMVRNQVYLFSYRIDIFNKNFPHQYSWNKIGLCALRLSTAYTISHFISKGRKFINIVIRVIIYIIDTGNDSSLYMHIFEYFHMCMNRGVTYVQVEERDIEWEGGHRERHRERKKWAG